MLGNRRNPIRAATAREVEDLMDEIKRRDVAAVNILLDRVGSPKRITFLKSPQPYYIHAKDQSHLYGTSRNTLALAILAALDLEG